MLVRGTCAETISTHQHVLVEVTVGVSKDAAVGSIAIPCPDCGAAMDKEIIE